MSKEKIILAIESAIQGGSISLQKGDAELGRWIGASSVSRAEDLLPNIDKMLRENSIAPVDLDLIAISSGPGSYTGIRIGIATALGLRGSLNIRCDSISVLEAIRVKFSHLDSVITAVPMGRGSVCLQEFTSDGSSKFDAPRLCREADFRKLLESENLRAFALHGSIFEQFQEIIKSMIESNIVNVGHNLAEMIGTSCRNGFGSKDLAPLFVEAC